MVRNIQQIHRIVQIGYHRGQIHLMQNILLLRLDHERALTHGFGQVIAFASDACLHHQLLLLIYFILHCHNISSILSVIFVTGRYR